MRRKSRVVLLDTERTYPLRRPVIGKHAIQNSKWQVARVRRQCLNRKLAGLVPSSRVYRPRRKLTQQGKLPLPDDPFGVLSVGAKYAPDCPFRLELGYTKRCNRS